MMNNAKSYGQPATPTGTEKRRRLQALAQLAYETGVHKESWFKLALAALATGRRWDEFKYRGLVQICQQRRTPHYLHTPFAIPSTADEIEAVAGPYRLGKIAGTNIYYCVSPKDLIQHGLIVGRTGAGKTTFVENLAWQIAREGVMDLLIIDPKAVGIGDFRALAREFRDVVVITPEMMRLNPLALNIPNLAEPLFREALVEVTSDSFGLFDAGEGRIAEHIYRAMSQPAPHFFHLVDSVMQVYMRSRYSQGYETIDTRLKKTIASLGHVVNCQTDYIPKLLNKRIVIIETGALSGAAQRILIPWVIMKVFLYHMANHSNMRLIIFDEAQGQIWSRNHELRGRTPYMSFLATTCRSRNIALAVLAQQVTKLMTSFIANSYIRVATPHSSGEEIFRMGQTLGLNKEQMEMLYSIRPGQAVCRMAGGFTEPVLIEFPEINDEPVTDAELEVLMRPVWDELLDGIEPVRTEQDIYNYMTGKPVMPKPANTKVQEEEPQQTSMALETQPELSQEEQIYLNVAKKFPFRLIGEIYSILGDRDMMGTERIARSQAVKLRKGLLKKGYLESTGVISGTGKSGRHQCDIVTEKANMGKVYKPRGGLIHAFWCLRISEYFRKQGATTKIGDTGNDGCECDIGVVLDGKRIGVEVVITGFVDNIHKHLANGFYNEMLFICDVKMQQSVEKHVQTLASELQQNVTVGLLKDYFVEL